MLSWNIGCVQNEAAAWFVTAVVQHPLIRGGRTQLRVLSHGSVLISTRGAHKSSKLTPKNSIF